MKMVKILLWVTFGWKNILHFWYLHLHLHANSYSSCSFIIHILNPLTYNLKLRVCLYIDLRKKCFVFLKSILSASKLFFYF